MPRNFKIRGWILERRVVRFNEAAADAAEFRRTPQRITTAAVRLQ